MTPSGSESGGSQGDQGEGHGRSGEPHEGAHSSDSPTSNSPQSHGQGPYPQTPYPPSSYQQSPYPNSPYQQSSYGQQGSTSQFPAYGYQPGQQGDQSGQSGYGHPTTPQQGFGGHGGTGNGGYGGTQPGSGQPGDTQPGSGHPGGGDFGDGGSRGTKSGKSRAPLIVGLVAACAVAGVIGGLVGANINDNDNSSSSSSRGSNVVLGGDVDSSQPAAAPAGSVQAVASKVLPSVVSIDVRSASAAGEGSGVVLSPDGVILTNNHVVSGAGSNAQIVVSFSDGSRSPATVEGTDPISDIAVIKVDKSGLTPIDIGTSGNLAVGQSVVAVGSPLGLAGTVTSGIISALNRPVSSQGEETGTASVIDAIQTDAAINPGNSGGALVNMNGALIGINTAIASLGGDQSSQSGSIGLGFAIPVDQAMRVAKELESTGKATQAGLGVSVRANGSAADNGAVITDVTAGGAAAKAGIPRGAVVTRVDDRVITNGDALVAAIRSHAPGDQVSITYTTGGQTKTVKVTLDTLEVGGR